MADCKTCGKKSLAQATLNIVRGYSKLLIKDADAEVLSQKRMEICSTCPLKRNLIKVGDKQYYYCGDCSCPLDAKTRVSEETCGLGKW